MSLIVVTLDFETYWDSEYTLTKMSPLEYVMDDRFETISVSIKFDDHPTDVLFGQSEIDRTFRKLNWSKYALCGHNMSGFDSYIAAYRFGVRPRMWMCTAAMARPIYAKRCGVSLAALAKEMGVGVKDNRALIATKGKRLADFTPEERAGMSVYNADDTELCRAIFKKLLPYYTSSELWQIDALTRLRTEPQFELDFGLLEAAASVERDRKYKSLLDLAQMLGFSWASAKEPSYVDTDDIGYDLDEPPTANDVYEFVRSQLASSAKFAELLAARGCEVPMKPSPTNPDNEVPALAKTDEAFLALQEHPDPIIAAAARARLDVKSTLFETRVQKFITAGNAAGGRLPIPIKYCGADTTGRDSGEDYNPQNMPRINPSAPKPTDALRRSLRAPDGYLVGVADQSGIELRINHFLWKVPSSMALYQASPDKADLYKAFAAENLYNVPADEVTKPQRQIGKISQLGLGFGSGAPTFRRIAKVMGGVDIPIARPDPPNHWFDGDGFLLPEFRAEYAEWEGALTCERIVHTWREAYREIVEGWRKCGAALEHIAAGKEVQVDPWGLVHTCAEGFVLPSGRLIRYPDLREEEDGYWPDGRPKRSWFYGQGRHRARITGPKADENIVQALARDSVFDCALEFYKRTGLRFALRVHDELVYVFPQREAPDLLAELQNVMRTPPKWWPDLVVWSEGDLARTYGDAK